MAPVVFKPVLSAEIHEGTLLHLLANHLVLSQTLPYLPPSSALNLAATSHAFRSLIKGATPFRRLNLTNVKSAHYEDEHVPTRGDAPTWRDRLQAGSQTEDEVYSASLRGVISKLTRFDLLSQVQTMILDGLSVTAEMVQEFLTSPAYNIRILSLRECKHLNETLLRQALRTACRRTRPEGTPKLKGLYLFTPREVERHSSSFVQIGGDAWYAQQGLMTKQIIPKEWAETLQDCQDVISFDAPLCRAPGHINSPIFGRGLCPPSAKQFAVATHAIGACSGCGGAPEGWTVWGEESSSDEHSRFPLLAPPPLLSSDVRNAMCPTGHSPRPFRFLDGGKSRDRARFIARCGLCLVDRYCANCKRWWCETCYPGPMAVADSALDTKPKAGVAKSCWECGNNCHDCIDQTQKLCKGCCGGYCLTHNEGSTDTLCDWCSKSTRRLPRDFR